MSTNTLKDLNHRYGGEGGGMVFHLDLKAFPLGANFSSVGILFHLRAALQLNAAAPCLL